MRNTRSCLIEGRDDCQQLKPKGSHNSFVTILPMLSILFGRVTVNVLVFVLRVVFFHVIFLCNAVHVRCSASGFCIISKFCLRV